MNAEYIAKSLEAIKVTQHGEETIPLQEFADFIRQQQAEIEALKEGIEKLKDAYCQRDSQVRQQQAEIEALKKDLDNANALIKLFSPIVARHSKSMQEQVNYLETKVYGGTTK